MIKKLTIPILSAALLFGAGTLGASAMLNQVAPVTPAITAAQLFDEFTTQDPAIITHLGIYIANNGNIKEIDAKGNTFLHYAAIYSDSCTINFLLDSGLDINAKNFSGHTALHLAAASSSSENVLFLLVCYCANVNEQDHCGKTPLDFAIHRGYPSIINILSEKGARS